MDYAALPSIRLTFPPTTSSPPASAAWPAFCQRGPGTGQLQSLITYPADGFCYVPEEPLTEKDMQEGLTRYTGADLSYVGRSKPFLAASGDLQPHTLTVMLPKGDYNQVLLKSALELVGLLLLCCFSAWSAACTIPAAICAPSCGTSSFSTRRTAAAHR